MFTFFLIRLFFVLVDQYVGKELDSYLVTSDIRCESVLRNSWFSKWTVCLLKETCFDLNYIHDKLLWSSVCQTKKTNICVCLYPHSLPSYVHSLQPIFVKPKINIIAEFINSVFTKWDWKIQRVEKLEFK